jgi:hypothetical protein
MIWLAVAVVFGLVAGIAVVAVGMYRESCGELLDKGFLCIVLALDLALAGLGLWLVGQALAGRG